MNLVLGVALNPLSAGMHELATITKHHSLQTKKTLLPKLKLKAAGMFQPEDHASKVAKSFKSGGRFGLTLATALNYGGIYGSGVLLFTGQPPILGTSPKIAVGACCGARTRW